MAEKDELIDWVKNQGLKRVDSFSDPDGWCRGSTYCILTHSLVSISDKEIRELGSIEAVKKALKHRIEKSLLTLQSVHHEDLRRLATGERLIQREDRNHTVIKINPSYRSYLAFGRTAMRDPYIESHMADWGARKAHEKWADENPEAAKSINSPYQRDWIDE